MHHVTSALFMHTHYHILHATIMALTARVYQNAAKSELAPTRLVASLICTVMLDGGAVLRII